MILSKLNNIIILPSLLIGLVACGGGGGTVSAPDIKSADLEKHVFIAKAVDADDSDDAFIFYQPTSGYLFTPDSHESFTWVVNDELLQVNAGGADDANFDLKSVVGNKYTFTVTDDDGTSTGDLYRGKPFLLADLDGKIFSTTISDCPATIKIDGADASVKITACGENPQVTEAFHIRQVESLNNVVELYKTVSGEGVDTVEQKQMVLIEGDVNTTSTIAILDFTDNSYNNNESLELKVFTKTDSEAF